MFTQTMDPKKAAAISARIIGARANGATMREAFDMVLGVGTYDVLVSDLYDAFRAQDGGK